MKKFIKFAALLMAVVLFMSTGESLTTLAATGPTISKTSRTIYVGGSSVYKKTSVYAKGTYTLSIKNRPEKYSIKWTSSDESVAKVAPKGGTSKYKGTVTAVAPGKATITATITTPYETIKKTCKVTVKKNCAAVQITPVSVGEIKVGETVALKGTMYDKAAREAVKGEDTTDTVKWMSSDTSVATVSSSGVVTAVGEGKATITCYTLQSTSGTYAKFKYATAKDTIDITVKEAGVTGMVEAKQLTLNSFKIEFASDFSKIVNKENLKVSRNGISADISKIEFDSTGKTATVTMTSSLTPTLDYLVELKGVEVAKGATAKFKASSGKPARMEMYTGIEGNRVIAGKTSDIYYRFYDANGVDITPADKIGTDYVKLVSNITIQQTNYDSLSSVFNNTVWIYQTGVSIVAVATYNDYLGTTFTASATITSVSEASTITGVEVLVTKSANQGFTLDWSNPSTSLSKSDINGYRVVARAKNAEGKYIYSDDAATKLTFDFPSDYAQKAVFLSASNGALYPFAEGSDQLLVKYDDVVVGAAYIIVGAERMPVRMATLVDGVESTMVEMSDASGVTNPEVKIIMYDNYGDVYPLSSILDLSVTTSEQVGAMYVSVSNINSDGTASLLMWANGAGLEDGRRQAVTVKYVAGTRVVANEFVAIIYKPNDKLNTEYRVVVQGDTDAVIDGKFDGATGKKLVAKLVAYKGRVRYQDISLVDAASAMGGQYYATVKLGDKEIAYSIGVSGGIEIPVAVLEGGKVKKAEPGDYSIIIYRKNTDGTTSTFVAGAHAVIKDTQEGAQVSRVSNYTTYSLNTDSTKSVMISAFNQCYEITIDGSPATVEDIDAIPLAGGMYVKTVTVTGSIKVGGFTYEITYPIQINSAVAVKK